MPTLLLLAHAALGQAYSLPTSVSDAASFYPTAYVEHAGADWSCGDLTSPGHRGTDFGGGGFSAMDDGRLVTAAADGTVLATNDGDFDRCESGLCAGGAGYGNFVQVEHDDGRSTLYAHLAQFSVEVRVGDVVHCGQALGAMGSSGFSSGPHVHFEVRDALGQPLDPFAGACGAEVSSWTAQGAYLDVPAVACDTVSGCTPVSELSCGAAIDGATDAPGATADTWQYGCSSWTYSGPEMSWTFATTLSEPVTLVLDGLAADLDLYVVTGTECDGTGCVGASTAPGVEPESVTFDATAGTSYVVVVDGWEGAVGSFHLGVACDGDAPEPGDTGEVTRDTGTGAIDTAADGAGGPSRSDGASSCGGCSTSSSPGAVFPSVLTACLLALVRPWSTVRHVPPASRRLFPPRHRA